MNTETRARVLTAVAYWLTHQDETLGDPQTIELENLYASNGMYPQTATIGDDHVTVVLRDAWFDCHRTVVLTMEPAHA